MAKARGDRLIITLGCTECRERTYTSSKSRRNDPDRLELRKFCPAAGNINCTGRQGSEMARAQRRRGPRGRRAARERRPAGGGRM